MKKRSIRSRKLRRAPEMSVLLVRAAVKCASYIDVREFVSMVRNAPGHLLSAGSFSERVVFCQNWSITVAVNLWQGV